MFCCVSVARTNKRSPSVSGVAVIGAWPPPPVELLALDRLELRGLNTSATVCPSFNTISSTLLFLPPPSPFPPHPTSASVNTHKLHAPTGTHRIELMILRI